MINYNYISRFLLHISKQIVFYYKFKSIMEKSKMDNFLMSKNEKSKIEFEKKRKKRVYSIMQQFHKIDLIFCYCKKILLFQKNISPFL